MVRDARRTRGSEETAPGEGIEAGGELFMASTFDIGKMKHLFRQNCRFISMMFVFMSISVSALCTRLPRGGVAGPQLPLLWGRGPGSRHSRGQGSTELRGVGSSEKRTMGGSSYVQLAILLAMSGFGHSYVKHKRVLELASIHF